MSSPPSVALLSTRPVYAGRVFDVVEESVRLPSGLRQDLAIVRHAGAVAVAAVDDEGRLVLVRQYRHAVGDWMLEVPAGRLEPGEAPLDTAVRELEEETGHRAGRWTLLRCFYPAPGFCSERMTLYLAEGITAVPGGGRACDADEEIEVVRRAPQELLASGACFDAKTLIAAASVRHLRPGLET